MKMNKKGFTLVEFVVSFSLITVILILLFEIIISVREIYFSAGIKTELLSRQVLMTEKINDDFYSNEIVNIVNCGQNCLTVSFSDGTSKNLSIDIENKIFQYGNYYTNLINNSNFDQPFITFKTFYNVGEDQYDSFVTIKIPVHHHLYKEDFGVLAIYQYDSRVTHLDTVQF